MNELIFSIKFQDGSEYYSKEAQLLSNAPFIGFNGVTQKLFSVQLKNGPSDWINLCTKIDFVNEEITYIANGVEYYKGPHTSVKAKNDMIVTSVEILTYTNGRVADVVLLTGAVSNDDMIAYTACQKKFSDNLIDFGATDNWGLKGSQRNISLGEPLFLPSDYCGRQVKTLIFPPNGFIENAELCRRFGK